MSVNIVAISNHIYTPWGVKYESLKWDDTWVVMLGIANKEVKGIRPYTNNDPFHKLYKYSINNIITWFDINVLQSMTVHNDQTTRVKLRIAQSMLDKARIDNNLRNKFKDAILDTYKTFHNSMWNKYLDSELPF